MFKLISSLVENIAGYISTFVSKDGKITKNRILYILIGIIFLIEYSSHNLVKNNRFFELLSFSSILSLVTYILIYLLSMLIKNK